MLRIKTTIVLLSCLISTALFAQTSSVLSTGRWIKMSFNESGVYRISHNQLNEMGFTPADVDPRNISIYGNPGGILPQSSSVVRPLGLTENAILVSGQEDGVFNENDFILFYVDEIDEIKYNELNSSFSAIKNIYSDQIHYFLTINETVGKRIPSTSNLGLSHPKIDWYNQIIFHETNEVNLLSSGREWFGEQFTIQNERTFDQPVPNLKSNQNIKLSVSVLAQSFSTSSLDINLNGSLIGDLSFDAIPNTQYGIKGSFKMADYSLATNAISSNNLSLNLVYQQNGVNNAIAYLNNFLLDIPTELSFQSSPLKIRSSESLNQAISTFEIQNSSSQMTVWDITDPTNVQNQELSLSGSIASYGAFTNTLKEYIAFEPEQLPTPEEFTLLDNQNLHGLEATDLIIITHADFEIEAQRLASHRRSFDQLSVTVVTIDQIYNEYSSGRQDITAVRDFIKAKYDLGNTLKYVLLFGKGSYDFKDRTEGNTNFVPTYESRNSIHPLLTYSSDDYFGFLDQDEGLWNESSAGDHMLDIGIGRIPVTTLEQAKRAIDKIILYQTNSNTLGDWRTKLLFVADDGDNNRHQSDADSLTRIIDTHFTDYNIQKLYLDAYQQVRLPTGEVSPSAEEALSDEVNNGALIVNFTGHGSESGWMQERILTFDLMEKWNNTYTLPFVVTATCEFGRNDDPKTFSGAENLMFKDVGGAISMVTTARPVFSSTNFDLSLALYNSVLKQESGEYQRLGDIIRFTKNNSLRGSLNRNFILLGDPSMRLSYPRQQVQITEINGNVPSQSDTIKALQRVVVKGQVMNGNNIDNNFTGTLNFNLFDKPSDKRTLGNEGAAFTYKERDSQLFRGTSQITNGEFEVEFIVPKNIDYSFGAGKMNVYAIHNDRTNDALGTSIDFIIGGTSSNIEIDETPPQITLFINDTTQNILPSYNSDLQFILKLFDDSGINISNNGLGQNLSITLNDSVTYNLNDHYISNLGNFRKGIAIFNIDDIPIGINLIEIKAWDIHGNSSTLQQEINIESNTSYITVINNSPNPFNIETQFNIEHLLEGENLEVSIQILNLKGEPVTTIYREVLSAREVITISWSGLNNNNQKLNNGIYIYNVNIYSKTSGKSAVKREKLIISN